jgi:hypothetical protein
MYSRAERRSTAKLEASGSPGVLNVPRAFLETTPTHSTGAANAQDGYIIECIAPFHLVFMTNGSIGSDFQSSFFLRVRLGHGSFVFSSG